MAARSSWGGVAVVDRAGGRGPGRGELAEGGELVLGQRLGGVEEEGPRRPVLQPLVEHGGLEAEALAAGGGGGDDDVLALQRGVDGGGLVRVEGPATELRQPRFEGGVQRVLEGLLDGVARGQGAVVDDLAVIPRQPAEPVEEGLDVHGRSVARGMAVFSGPRGGCTASRLFPLALVAGAEVVLAFDLYGAWHRSAINPKSFAPGSNNPRRSAAGVPVRVDAMRGSGSLLVGVVVFAFDLYGPWRRSATNPKSFLPGSNNPRLSAAGVPAALVDAARAANARWVGVGRSMCRLGSMAMTCMGEG